MFRWGLPVLVLLVGCAPRGESADSVGGGPARAVAGEATVGVVRVVGSAPINVQVVLQPEQGQSVRLTGPLVPQLEQLAGARVAVEGEITPSPDPIADWNLEASGYRVLDVNGRPVVMGVIEAISGTDARLRTDEGEIVNVQGIPESFRVGQRVWVQGPRNLRVQSYGIIE